MNPAHGEGGEPSVTSLIDISQLSNDFMILGPELLATKITSSIHKYGV